MDAMSAMSRRRALTRAADGFQIGQVREAHLMECNVVFTLSISLIATMPSAV